MRFCTIFTTTTLPHARVLADALARHHPGAALHALALGEARVASSRVPFEVVSVEDLELDADDPGDLMRAHLAQDLMLLLLPALLAHVRAVDGAADLCYLSVDHDVLAPIATALDGGVGIVRRLEGELPDDTFAPDAEDLTTHGLCTPDFLLLGRGGRSQEFLDWYGAQLWTLKPRLALSAPPPSRDAARRRARGLLTVAPTLFGLRTIEDPGLEVSAWNLQARPLRRDNGRVLARHSPLRTMHFAGFDPRKPYWLAGHADRVRVVEDPVLRELCDDYAQRLLQHGQLRFDRRRDVGRRLPNGLVFDARVVALYEEALCAGAELGDIFTAPGCEELMSWMLGPAAAGAAAGVNRYMHRIYLDRPDLAQAFPNLDGIDGAGYATWTWVFGRNEMSIPDQLLPPLPGLVVDDAPAPAPEPAPAPAPGVNVAGFFKGTLGLGEAARLYVKALAAAGVPVTTTTVEVDRPVYDADRRLGRDYGKLAFADLQAAEDCAFNLICVNADELPRFAANCGADFFAGRRTIGVWAWETDVVPDRWEAAYEHLDEIWVYSRYVAENLGRASPIPVVCVPPPVVAPDSAGVSSGVQLPQGFRFMFMFDFFSTQRRKNPIGVIEAFTRAFAPGEGPQLLIKTIHAEARPLDYDELRHAAVGRADVHVVDLALSAAAKDALMTECDCYVSLHRSEGYGLTLAECMALGKPVIGTAYSGNLDFMSPANSYLVDHTMTVVGGEVEIYPPEGRWAEPDLDHAAALMREVHADPEAARARGLRAQRDIAASLAPEVVGLVARARLERLVARGLAAAVGDPITGA